MNYLTPSELKTLTGRSHAAKQCAWLTKNQWEFTVDKLGKPQVDRNYHDATMMGHKPKPIPVLTRKPPSPTAAIENFLRGTVIEARKRAKRRDMECDLTHEFIVKMATKQGFKCALSGVPFSIRNRLPGKRSPFAPSIDRIKSTNGYTAGNVRLVACAVNYLMNEWGDEVYHALAKAILERVKTP